MTKTKNEVELEIRVEALEDTIQRLLQLTSDYTKRTLPDLAEYKVKHFQEMKAKHPELGIEYPT